MCIASMRLARLLLKMECLLGLIIKSVYTADFRISG